MLTHLFISNVVLIEKLELEFSSGLTIFSGETGAGKSILLDGIGWYFSKSPTPLPELKVYHLRTPLSFFTKMLHVPPETNISTTFPVTDLITLMNLTFSDNSPKTSWSMSVSPSARTLFNNPYRMATCWLLNSNMFSSPLYL